MGLFGKFSRRDLLKSSSVAAGAVVPFAAATPQAEAAVSMPSLNGREPDNIFTRIGVRPIINGRGTYTIISGSRSLPEVKRAMFEASHYYVHMDEMMDAVGAQLAKLTGAEWGIVTNGAESAICLATIACIAGGNVEKCQALPYVKAKDQVIIPKHSRNPYDMGVRMVGAELVEVETPEEARAKISPRTAMIYVMSDPVAEKGPLSIPTLIAIAKEAGVPILVDAAAEEPLNPNPHLSRGATLVCYSGGKCLRGPQSSGMLLGSKELCKAAYYQAAPHHAYGRALKCSKEETMGLLAAITQWYKRDHAAEQKMWLGWMQGIEKRLTPIKSARFEYLEPPDLSNRATRLKVSWDASVVGITGNELVARLDAGTPRIMVFGDGERPDTASSITIMPYMLDPGESQIIGDAIYAIMSNPGPQPSVPVASGTPAAIGGNWAVTIEYFSGRGAQKFTLQQNGKDITGMQHGEIYNGRLRGTVNGNSVTLRSNMMLPGNPFTWTFKGEHQGDRMGGTVNMGEYGPAKWTAVRA